MEAQQNYQLLRYKLYQNPKEKVDPIFDRLLLLSYDFVPGGKDHLILEVANGKDKSKAVVKIVFFLIFFSNFPPNLTFFRKSMSRRSETNGYTSASHTIVAKTRVTST
jgi:hypothetical protein